MTHLGNAARQRFSLRKIHCDDAPFSWRPLPGLGDNRDEQLCPLIRWGVFLHYWMRFPLSDRVEYFLPRGRGQCKVWRNSVQPGESARFPGTQNREPGKFRFGPQAIQIDRTIFPRPARILLIYKSQLFLCVSDVYSGEHPGNPTELP